MCFPVSYSSTGELGRVETRGDVKLSTQKIIKLNPGFWISGVIRVLLCQSILQ